MMSRNPEWSNSWPQLRSEPNISKTAEKSTFQWSTTADNEEKLT